VVQTDGHNFIYKGLPEALVDELDNNKNIEDNLGKVIGGNYVKEACDAHIMEVPIQDVLDTFCHMQDFIASSSGLWATDVPEKFEDHPAYELLFRLKYSQPK
jgi:hypothetical protein